MPKFTVLLPTHSHSATLGISIRSILNQTERDFELFIVGDGCDRACADVVASFSDPRIRFFDLEKSLGVGYPNRNIALREARGELVAYASDDDIIFPKHLELLGLEFDQRRIRWAYCRPIYVTTYGLLVPEFANFKLHYTRKTFMERACMIPSGSVAHRRSLLDEVGYFREDMERGGDWELWRRFVTEIGQNAIGFQRKPTILHFNTDWRVGEPAEYWPKGLSYLQAIAQFSRSYPKSLRLAEDGSSAPLLQAVANDLLNSDPRYPEKIANAVNTLQDHLAWSASRDHGLL